MHNVPSSLPRHIIEPPVSSEIPPSRSFPVREIDATTALPLHIMFPEYFPRPRTQSVQLSQEDPSSSDNLDLLAQATQQSASYLTRLPQGADAFPMAMQTPVDRRGAAPVQVQEKGKQRYQSPVRGQPAPIASASRSPAAYANAPACASSRQLSSSIPLWSLLPIPDHCKNLETPAMSQNLTGIGEVSTCIAPA